MLALLLVAVAATPGESQFFLPGDREAVYAFVEHGTESAHRSALQSLYRFTGYQLVWIRNARPTAQALALVARLETAEQKGLRPEDYDGPLWAERIERMGQPAQFDVVLSSRVIRYVSDLSRGRVNPRVTADDESELGFLVYRLSHAPDVDPPLAAAEPALPFYRRSLEALQTYLGLAARDDGVRVRVPRKPVEPGGKYVGAAELARRLRFLGDLPVYGVVPAKPVFAGDLVKAVERFQSRHGLAATGRLDARTVRLINVPLERRIAQLRLTLERLRWLPRSSPSPRMIVTVPELRLHVEGPGAFSTGVAVGRGCRRQMPILTGVSLSGSPSGFAATVPDLRRGCIRVEDPEGLARWLLRKGSAWTAGRIRGAIDRGDTARAEVKESVLVLVLYSTAVVSEDGRVHFFEDVYGLDRKLSVALGEAPGVL